MFVFPTQEGSSGKIKEAEDKEAAVVDRRVGVVDKGVPVEEDNGVHLVEDRGVHVVEDKGMCVVVDRPALVAVGVAEETSKGHHITTSSSHCLTGEVEAEGGGQAGETRTKLGSRISLTTVLLTRRTLAVLTVAVMTVFNGTPTLRKEGK